MSRAKVYSSILICSSFFLFSTQSTFICWQAPINRLHLLWVKKNSRHVTEVLGDIDTAEQHHSLAPFA